MTEDYFVGVYWGDRPETLAACVDRSAALLTDLSKVDPVMGSWTSNLKRKKAQLIHLPEDRPLLEQLLVQGQNREGLGPVIAELGYRVRVWSKLSPQEAAILDLHLGAYGSHVVNSCVLQLPYGEPSAGRLLQAEKLTALTGLLVSRMEPDAGRVSPPALLIHPEIKEVGAHRVGWLTYLAVEPSLIPPLPPPARVEPLGKGSLIIATDERLTVSNPDHINLVIQIHHALKKAGLPIDVPKRASANPEA